MHGSEFVLNDSANVALSTAAGVGGMSYMLVSVLINVWSLSCSLYSTPCITYLRNPLCSSLQWFVDVNSTTSIQI